MLGMNRGIKAIVLSWDRHRVITRHMIGQYGRLWPDHPFIFRIPFQKAVGVNSPREEYIQTPPDICGTVLGLIADLEDEEWIYWCADDKYPIRLVTQQFAPLFNYAYQQSDMSGLLCCRCRVTLTRPDLSITPSGRRITPAGEVLLERRKWYQIWIHQLLRVKVLRYLFTQMPKDLPNAKTMDKFKNDIAKPYDLKMYVTERNYAVFGESTQRGILTQNCYRSMRDSGIHLPQWFRRHNGNHVTMGELLDDQSTWSRI